MSKKKTEQHETIQIANRTFKPETKEEKKIFLSVKKAYSKIRYSGPFDTIKFVGIHSQLELITKTPSNFHWSRAFNSQLQPFLKGVIEPKFEFLVRTYIFLFYFPIGNYCHELHYNSTVAGFNSLETIPAESVNLHEVHPATKEIVDFAKKYDIPMIYNFEKPFLTQNDEVFPPAALQDRLIIPIGTEGQRLVFLNEDGKREVYPE